MTDPKPSDSDSILQSIKKLLGIASEYDQFDLDITLHINSVLSTLTQLGVGPQDNSFILEDATQTWDDFLGTKKNLAMVKSYVFLKVRLMFDPPASGFGLDAMTKMATEYEWRLNVAQSSTPNI